MIRKQRYGNTVGLRRRILDNHGATGNAWYVYEGFAFCMILYYINIIPSTKYEATAMGYRLLSVNY